MSEPMARDGARQWPVAQVSELPPGARCMVEVKGHSIGLFNVNGAFIAVLKFSPVRGMVGSLICSVVSPSRIVACVCGVIR